MTATAEFPAIGTSARLVVDDPGALDAARAVLEDELAGIDRAASRFRPDSELSLVEAAPRLPRRISGRLAEAVAAALWAARATGGAVDPTVAAAISAAGYDRDFVELSDPAVEARPAGHAAVPGWTRVFLDRAARVLSVPDGVRLDLGATAKALAADRAARLARHATGSAVLVSLGGDVSVAGDRAWSVGVGDDHAAEPDEVVQVWAGGVATSSTAVRRWSRGGAVLHHIIDPGTGKPVDSVWRTATVAAGSCLSANTASTAAIVLGERAPAWLAQRGLPARLVAHDGEVLRVAGWPEEAA